MEAIRIERVQDAAIVNGGQVVDKRAWFCPFSVPALEISFGDGTTVTVTREVACKLAASLTEFARDG